MGDIEEEIWKQILIECDSDQDGKVKFIKYFIFLDFLGRIY